MRRKANYFIEAWIKRAGQRAHADEKKCLLVMGARQVGKTFSIRQVLGLSKRTISGNADLFGLGLLSLELNLEENPEYKEIFEGALDAGSVIANIGLIRKFRGLGLSLTAGRRIVLFIDEIQSCPKAITALKFLAEDPNLVVIASGSALGTSLAQVSSFPVGYVDFLQMHPLDFEEYLWNLGYSDATIDSLVTQAKKQQKLTETTHQELLERFRQYIVVGGMPSVVAKYANGTPLDFAGMRKDQRGIIQAYRNDLAKYGGSEVRIKAQECFDSIPSQLAKDNKKFMYRAVNPTARSSTYGGSLDWLNNAGIISECSKLNAIAEPLAAQKLDGQFKVYMADSGLLVSMLDEGTAQKIVSGELGIYKGAVYENAVGQCLTAAELPLYYYEKNSGLEIDFVEPIAGNIYPLEVKAGDNSKSRSLGSVLAGDPSIRLGIRLSAKQIGRFEKGLSLPLYLVPFLRQILQ